MTTISQTLGPGVLKFGETGSEREFSSATTKTEFSPEVKTEDAVALLDGSHHQPTGEWGGTISGTFYQEYGAAGLIAWCFEHAGELMPFVFTPRSGTGLITFSGQCTIQPVKVGGDVLKENTTDFSFTIVGKPDMTTASA